MRRFLASKWAKVAVFVLSAWPLAYLIWRTVRRDLTANPVEFYQHQTGDWTLRLLLLTLAVSPLRKILRLPELVRVRRMLGLFAFFYVCLHFLTYLGPDQGFALSGMLVDVAKRPFITAGFAAFLLLIPLALTSTGGWIRRLGGRRWQALHRAVYLAAALGVVHYYWLVKSDIRKPLLYGVLLGILLAWRFASWIGKKRTGAGAAAAETSPARGA